MADLFEHKILCKNCNIELKKGFVIKNGFKIRTFFCEKCSEKILHPDDLQEYNNFKNLRNKEFKVKLRLVGNSYAVSIPKQIVEFMREQEKIMDDLVTKFPGVIKNYTYVHDVKAHKILYLPTV